MPQIFVDGEFRAGYEAFEQAVECERLEVLLASSKTFSEGEFPLH